MAQPAGASHTDSGKQGLQGSCDLNYQATKGQDTDDPDLRWNPGQMRARQEALQVVFHAASWKCVHRQPARPGWRADRPTEEAQVLGWVIAFFLSLFAS